jgi:hypothetical protein
MKQLIETENSHLLLDTALLSVLCLEHDRSDQPAIALWNSDAMERTEV